MPCVYIITNKLNGKIYVGQTEQTAEDRFKDHVWSRNKQDHFHAALRKYGKDAFVVQELGRYDTLEETNNAEALWILLLRSYDSKIGYNTKFGGQNGGQPTEETRAKIGLASSQRSHTPATKKQMREAHIRRSKTRPEAGIGLTRVGRYRVRTKVHGKEIQLGIFDTLEEAIVAKQERLQRLEEIGLDAFLIELKDLKAEVTKQRIASRPHRGPVSEEEKEQISIRTKKRWATNFNWMDAQFVAPAVDAPHLVTEEAA